MSGQSSADIVERRTLASGEFIFREGEQGQTAYIVQSGEVEIVRIRDGEENVLATIPQGGIFGEMALVDSQPRMASARMSKGGTVIVVTEDMFNRKLNKTDPFIRGLLNIFVDTIRRLQNK